MLSKQTTQGDKKPY